MNKYIFISITLLTFSFSLFSKDWLPDGMMVDKNGNIIQSVSLDEEFTGPKKSLTTLAYVATIDQGRSIINLSKPSFFKKIKSLNDKKKPPNDGSGFLVTQAFRLDVPPSPVDFLAESVGAFSIGKVFPTIVAPQMGILIAAQAGIVGKLFIKKYEDIDKLPTILKIPDDQNSLNKYEIGDSLTYEANGGLGIMFGVGSNTYNAIKEKNLSFLNSIPVASLSAGIGSLIQGEWICSIKKTGKSTIQARYINKKIKKMMFYANAAAVLELAAYEATKYEGTGIGAFYEFDISKPKGLKSYKHFLKGSAISAFKMVSDFKAKEVFSHGQSKRKGKKRKPMKLPVRPLMDYKSNYKGEEERFSYNLPFLYGIQNKKGFATVSTETKIPGKNSSIKTHLGVYRKEKDSFGYFKKDYYRLSMFAGTHQVLKHIESDDSVSIQKRVSGNYKYHYHNGSLSEGDLESEIYKMAAMTGFKKELYRIKISSPNFNMRKYLESKKSLATLKSFTRKKDLGTAKISLDLMLSMNAIQEIKSKALTGNVFKQSAMRRLDNWFQDKNNKRWEICTTLLKGQSSKMGRDLCKRKMKKETKSEVSNALKSLIGMQRYIGQRQYENFAKEFSKFGKALIKNQFVFRGFLDNITIGDYHIVVRWAGENFPQGEHIVRQSRSFKFKGLKRIAK